MVYHSTFAIETEHELTEKQRKMISDKIAEVALATNTLVKVSQVGASKKAIPVTRKYKRKEVPVDNKDEKLKETTGEIIIRKRKEAGMNTAELSRKSGVDVTTLNRWEKGNRTPNDFYLLKKVADAFGCKVEDLIDIEDAVKGETTGEIVMRKRKAAGMNRSELSRRSGVPISTLNSWENGSRKPNDVYQLKKVADVFGCKIEDLIEFE